MFSLLLSSFNCCAQLVQLLFLIACYLRQSVWSMRAAGTTTRRRRFGALCPRSCAHRSEGSREASRKDCAAAPPHSQASPSRGPRNHFWRKDDTQQPQERETEKERDSLAFHNSPWRVPLHMDLFFRREKTWKTYLLFELHIMSYWLC